MEDKIILSFKEKCTKCINIIHQVCQEYGGTGVEGFDIEEYAKDVLNDNRKDVDGLINYFESIKFDSCFIIKDKTYLINGDKK